MPKRPRFDLEDVVFLLGAACVVAGVWWMYAPLGLVLAGLLFLASGFVMGE